MTHKYSIQDHNREYNRTEPDFLNRVTLRHDMTHCVVKKGNY